MVVVEIPLLDRMSESLDVADEIVGVLCPLATRRAHAIQRGMSGNDFDQRVAQQPSDEYIREHAAYVFNNTGSLDALQKDVRNWWSTRQASNWA